MIAKRSYQAYETDGPYRYIHHTYACRSRSKIMAYLSLWLVRRCVAYLANYMKPEGAPISDGFLWERTPIDVRFDQETGFWYGYWRGCMGKETGKWVQRNDPVIGKIWTNEGEKA